MKKIVVFGGGKGLSCLLSGLKLFPVDVTTVIAVSDKAMPQYVEFTADRPFLYTISERSTGSIFFIGQFMGNTTSDIRSLTPSPEENRITSGRRTVYDLQGRKITGDKLRKGLYIVGGKKVAIE